MKKNLLIILTILIFDFPVFACIKNASKTSEYVWNEITPRAAFPQSYNYPVFVLNDGKMLALNQGGWTSDDGQNWTKTRLPESNLNSAYQKYVQFKGAVYALGALNGNYEKFTIDTKILRTTNGKSWEIVSKKSNLPQRFFYGAAVYKDKIWLVGGFDGKRYYNDVWTSTDGANWTRVAKKTNFSARNISKIVVFKDRIWIIGGDVIDGDKIINPNSDKEVWSSSDGINWMQNLNNAADKLSGTPVVFDDKLWLIGGNRRDGNFANAIYVSDDGENWKQQSAPWSPRGGTVAWVFQDKLFMTGGKYSFAKNGEITFAYSNDIWTMTKAITN